MSSGLLHTAEPKPRKGELKCESASRCSVRSDSVRYCGIACVEQKRVARSSEIRNAKRKVHGPYSMLG